MTTRLSLSGKSSCMGSQLFQLYIPFPSGNLLGPVINTTIEGGLEKFFRQPTGCGEQTMLFLAPNVYVLEYLMNTKQISGASAESAHRFIQSGMYSFLSNMRHLVFCQILVSPKGSLSEKSFLNYFLLINKYRSLVCVLFCCKALREAARARKMCRQNRAQSRLLYLFYNKESVKFLKHYFQFSKQTLFPKRTTVSSACSLLLLSKLQ